MVALFLGMGTSLANTNACLDQKGVACGGEFVNPKTPLIRQDESIRGTVGAPLVLVKYSNFLCPHCATASATVKTLLTKYEGKIQFIYKHFIGSHPYSVMVSQYYEAIRLQDEEKAFLFHDEIFGNHRMLRQGPSFLESVANELDVDMTKLATDMNSTQVAERINQDVEEAIEMGFQGTPSFLINGVSVKGAYPAEHFVKIIDKLVEMGKVTL